MILYLFQSHKFLNSNEEFAMAVKTKYQSKLVNQLKRNAPTPRSVWSWRASHSLGQDTRYIPLPIELSRVFWGEGRGAVAPPPCTISIVKYTFYYIHIQQSILSPYTPASIALDTR